MQRWQEVAVPTDTARFTASTLNSTFPLASCTCNVWVLAALAARNAASPCTCNKLRTVAPPARLCCGRLMAITSETHSQHTRPTALARSGSERATRNTNPFKRAAQLRVAALIVETVVFTTPSRSPTTKYTLVETVAGTYPRLPVNDVADVDQHVVPSELKSSIV